MTVNVAPIVSWLIVAAYLALSGTATTLGGIEYLRTGAVSAYGRVGMFAVCALAVLLVPLLNRLPS